MNMHFYVEGNPVSWSAHKGFGRKSFNPKYKEREFYRWKLLEECEEHSPIECAVRIDILYQMTIPSSYPKKFVSQIEQGRVQHVKRPDLDNLNKFLLDCMKGVVFKDDSQVYQINCRKEYGKKPGTHISVYPYDVYD